MDHIFCPSTNHFHTTSIKGGLHRLITAQGVRTPEAELTADVIKRDVAC